MKKTVRIKLGVILEKWREELMKLEGEQSDNYRQRKGVRIFRTTGIINVYREHIREIELVCPRVDEKRKRIDKIIAVTKFINENY